MQKFKLLFVMSLLLLLTACANTAAVTSSINPTQLRGYEKYPPQTQMLIRKALALTRQNLNYQFGSASPQNAGMDCSGTIYFLLHSMNIKNVPRSSDQQYLWVKNQGQFHRVNVHSVTSPELAQLKPGDLLFWSGTYRVKRKVPVTHVMMYLGRNNRNRPVVFGASNGEPYNGRSMRGVSVFDLVIPKPRSRAKFVGYGCIPTLTCHQEI